jgi:hypothetical protein
MRSSTSLQLPPGSQSSDFSRPVDQSKAACKATVSPVGHILRAGADRDRVQKVIFAKRVKGLLHESPSVGGPFKMLVFSFSLHHQCGSASSKVSGVGSRRSGN